MHFKPQGALSCCLIFAFFYSLFLSKGSWANTDFEFNVKPNRCLVNQLGDSCQFTAKFKWRLSQPMAVCLWQEKRQLKCWAKKMSAEYQIQLTLSQSTDFYLINEQEQVLAKQSIQLQAHQPAKYRRRLHSQWSLF
ncbi:DUF3019 domain-containing protein [Catenovulum adriaticum]|uniref:DUF3019 domain-containing protein n=1 Tax=Catenovulum adriaticum TaxID=2984846 RepID=A0ABY7AND7_9ALTE|nr:DUF3019 domain-containing protein [Catenovulum sp. TS8]WAJ71068.1 DUF3019 domain-containing protein [Catenovulum sp. TS8]